MQKGGLKFIVNSFWVSLEKEHPWLAHIPEFATDSSGQSFMRDKESKVVYKVIKEKGKKTQVYSCSECEGDIQSARVEHQIWGNPHESVYESIPYCPNCETKPGPLVNPITQKQARAWPEP